MSMHGRCAGKQSRLRTAGSLALGMARRERWGEVMGKPRQPHLRLAFVEGRATYKSGRRRCRSTPVALSTSSTRSAGTFPSLIQREMLPCDLSPSALAKASCPPTASQASSNAVLLMPEINAQTVDGVNAPTGNWRAKNARMPKKPTVHEPSEFWLRLEEAMSEKWGLEDFNANSVAMHLDMSQGTTHRWFLGTGLPEPKLALTFCKRAGVCFDWLMNGVKPKYPISKDPLLRELFEICEQIPKESRATVLSIAKGELAKKKEIESEAKTVNRGGHLRSV